MSKDSQAGFHTQDNRKKRIPQFDTDLRKNQVRAQSEHGPNKKKPASRPRPGLFLFGLIILLAGVVGTYTLVNQKPLEEKTTDTPRRLTPIQICDEELSRLGSLKKEHEQRLWELDERIQDQVRFIKSDTVRDPLALKDLESMIRNKKIQNQELAKTNAAINRANRNRRHYLNKPYTEEDERDVDAPTDYAAVDKQAREGAAESSAEESWLDAALSGDTPTDEQEIKREIERLLSESEQP